MKNLIIILAAALFAFSCTDPQGLDEVKPTTTDTMITQGSTGTTDTTFNPFRSPVSFRAYFYADPAVTFGAADETGLNFSDNYGATWDNKGYTLNLNTPVENPYFPAYDLKLDTLPCLVNELFATYDAALKRDVEEGDTLRFTLTPIDHKVGILYYVRCRSYKGWSEVLTFTETSTFEIIVPGKYDDFVEMNILN